MLIHVNLNVFFEVPSFSFSNVLGKLNVLLSQGGHILHTTCTHLLGVINDEYLSPIYGPLIRIYGGPIGVYITGEGDKLPYGVIIRCIGFDVRQIIVNNVEWNYSLHFMLTEVIEQLCLSSYYIGVCR